MMTITKSKIIRSNIPEVEHLTSDGEEITTFDRVKECLEKGKIWMRRMDIFMVYDQINSRQYFVEPSRKGPKFGNAINYMDDEEIQWCIEENERIKNICEKYPDFANVISWKYR